MQFTHLSKFSITNVFLNLAGLIGLGMQTLRNQEWTEFSWRNNVYIDKFSVEKRLENGFHIEHYSHRTLFSWGNND